MKRERDMQTLNAVVLNPREFGLYKTKKRGAWGISEFTPDGWKVDWSDWFQEDDDFEYINEYRVVGKPSTAYGQKG
jgi:hypothetical protein